MNMTSLVGDRQGLSGQVPYMGAETAEASDGLYGQVSDVRDVTVGG